MITQTLATNTRRERDRIMISDSFTQSGAIAAKALFGNADKGQGGQGRPDQKEPGFMKPSIHNYGFALCYRRLRGKPGYGRGW